LQQVKEIVLAQEREKAYNAKIKELQGAHPDLDIDGDAIAPFVVTAEGDWDTAVKEYEKWYSRFKPREVSPEDVPDPPEAPQVLGDAPTPPPTEKKYANMDEALDDWFAEERAKTAPPTL
jgi:hypothetical protein